MYPAARQGGPDVMSNNGDGSQAIALASAHTCWMPVMSCPAVSISDIGLTSNPTQGHNRGAVAVARLAVRFVSSNPRQGSAQ